MTIDDLKLELITLQKKDTINALNKGFKNKSEWFKYVINEKEDEVASAILDIAKRYNTSTSNIISLNNLKNNNLSIGQVLKIPISNNTSNTIKYTVKAGDNLYSIAKKYNTTTNDIKKKNNLSSNLLSVGQVLII